MGREKGTFGRSFWKGQGWMDGGWLGHLDWCK